MAGKTQAVPVEPEAAGVVDVDRVALVSVRADGTPDQGPGFEVIGQD